MKIEITRAELLEILTAHFNRNVTECVISKLSNTFYKKIEQALIKELNMPFGKNLTQSAFTSQNKIPAIKALRVIVGGDRLGIGEAKWAVENWDAWRKYLTKNGKLPTFTGEYGSWTLAT